MKKIIAIILCLSLFVGGAYAQKGGSRSFSGGSSRSSSSSSRSYSAPSRSYSAPSRPSAPRISSSNPGSSIAKARAVQQSAVAKSNSIATKSATTTRSTSSYVYNKTTTNPPVKTNVATQSVNNTRNVRITNVYKSYPSHYNNYHYNDSFHPFLTGMLIGRLMDNNHHTETVRYIHSHWDEFDDSRKQQLLRENSSLKDELAKLQGVPSDANANLTGVDRDVMYNDHVVSYHTRQSAAGWFGFIFGWMLAILVFTCIIWGIFVMKRDI